MRVGKKKNGPDKLIRSHTQWVAKHNHNRRVFLQEEVEKAKEAIVSKTEPKGV